MAFKLGTINHAKGFIISKLFEQKRMGGSHLPVELLSQGYPPRFRHLIDSAFEKLKSENPSAIQVRMKRTGRGSSMHVSLNPTQLASVRGLMNGYRKAVGLPPYGRDFKTLLPIQQPRTHK